MVMLDKSQEKNTSSKRVALGKGIHSLLGDIDETPDQKINPKTTPDTYEEKVLQIPVSRIEGNPHQPRKIFEDKSLHELASSIKENGLLQPVLLTLSETPGTYTLIAGERRLRASKLAGIETIPAIVKTGTHDDLLKLALIENIQREDLNIIEEAEAYNSLIRDFGLTQEQCATSVGKDRSTITNALRLLSLPSEIQDDLLDGKITMGHGRAILSIEDQKLMLKARDIIIKKCLSVRETEQLCKNFKKPHESISEKSEPKDKADLEYIADLLRNHLKTKVKISGSSNRGKIEISYFSSSELERIMGVFSKDFR